MANALTGNFGPLAALDYVQQQGEIGRQRGIDNRLNQLASLSYSANTPQAQQDNLAQVAALDRSAAAEQQKTFQSQEDRNRTLVYNAARYLKGALDRQNPAEIAGTWRAVRPGLINAGLATEQELSPDWQPDYAQTVHQALAMGGGASSDVVQSQKIGEDGFIYNTFRDGRIVNTGVKADRQMWLRDNPGMPPELVGKDQVARPVVSGVGAAPTRSDMEADISLANEMIAAGIPDTQVDAFLAARGARGGTAANPAAVAQARPSAAQEAADAERARTAVRNENFGIDLEQDRLRKEQEAKIEADKAIAVQQAKSEQERASTARAKSAALGNVNRGLERIDKALTAVEGLRGVDSGPLDQYLVARTREGQELAAAVGAIEDSMLALTRVPGVGSQSDLEARMAKLKYPDLGNYPSVNRNNFRQLKEFAQDLERQFGGDSTSAPQSAGPQPGAVEDGYRFRGGNPSDPNNWERI